MKLSGEALAGTKGYGIDPVTVDNIAGQIQEVLASELQIAIVNGGGNIWRGLSGASKGMDRATADYMGMLATIINSLGLAGCFGKSWHTYQGTDCNRDAADCGTLYS